MKNLLLIALIIFAAACETGKKTESTTATTTPEIGTLEVVAELDINPGNVAVSKEGRVFTTVHPMRAPDIQLIEVLGDNQYVAFPDTSMQSAPDGKSLERFDTPLGIVFDRQDRLWAIDAGLSVGKTRLYAFNIETNETLIELTIPEAYAPSNSFTQDLAIDEENGFVYLADFGDPGIIALNIKDTTYSKVTHESMLAEDMDMVIDGNVVQLNGAPVRIGLNPITISDDRSTIYYGAMNGTKWYSISAGPIRNGTSTDEILSTIQTVGPKPFSDGSATDEDGNHYITNIQNSSIYVLSSDGTLSTLVKDDLLDWPDNARIHQDWVYVAVNQLHKAPAFTGGEERATGPYRILRVRFR